ncbi:MAG: hypothetical protein V4717_24445 [Bacteroidota bacterium]
MADEEFILNNLYSYYYELIVSKVIEVMISRTDRGVLLYTDESPFANEWEDMSAELKMPYLQYVDGYKNLLWNLINEEVHALPEPVKDLIFHVEHEYMGKVAEMTYSNFVDEIIEKAKAYKNEDIVAYLKRFGT